MLEQIIGKKSSSLSGEQFLERCAAFDVSCLDLGTGDGMFAYRRARQEPDTLVVGIDADRRSLGIGSSKARRKPTAGGCRNVIFICRSALDFPSIFHAVFGRAYINFPWGSLLQAVAEPRPEFMAAFSAVLKTGARVEINLNMHVFSESKQRETLDLPKLTSERITEELLPLYLEYGFECLHWNFVGREIAEEIPSTWAGRLAKSSGRETLRLVFKKR